ncbi:hypothetical protein E4634_10490 [Mangrovimicrobium sediminis]|uniref:Lipoprotein n=1 Tax=Mangrovimicrobium sediminis TaxID=2562682 RepID=A0A4Z0M191_9GAMM|nr:hypothetical protein [Haliea sp. SAOS-164]TGD73453.1 hypothetical protein E4634_10490 [Haliea sp. SAOS-164]
MYRLAVCLAAAVALNGCAGDKWADYNYGPADWLAEHTAVEVVGTASYDRLVEPLISVHRIDDDLSAHCGSVHVAACAIRNGETCDIYIGSRAAPGVLEHEMRHCHGWDHYEPEYARWNAMTPQRRAFDTRIAQSWYPAVGGE